MEKMPSSEKSKKDSDTSRDKHSFVDVFSRSVLKIRWLILALLLLLSAFTISGLTQLKITVNIKSFFLEDDPILKNQEKFHKLFHNNDFVGVLVESEDVFSRESLELIKKVGERLQKNVPLAKDIISLTNLKNPFLQGIKLQFKKGRLISSDEKIRQFKSFCNKTPSLRGVLFSTDNRQAWIQLKLFPYPSPEKWTGTLEPLFTVGKTAYDIIKSINPGNARLTATGVPVYAHRKEVEMVHDLMVVLAIGAIVALFLSILIFRSIQGVAGTMLVIILGVITVFGIQGWLGVTTDSAFISVPILLAMGVGIGYTVHISRFFNLHFHETGGREESVHFALSKSAKPVLFTAFTTIVALLSFIFVKIKPIQWVGLTSAFCILSVYILSMVLFPIILSFGRDRKILQQKAPRTDFLKPVLRRFSYWIGEHSVVIIMIFLIVSGVALWGVSKLKVDFDAEKTTGTKLQHMKDQIHIGKSEIATSDTLDLVLVMPAKSFNKLENLKRLEILEKKILKLPLVKKTSSIAGVIREVNYFIHSGSTQFDRLPQEKSMLNLFFYYMKKFAPEHLTNWATEDYSTSRIFIQLTNFSSHEIEQNISKIDDLVRDIFPPKTTHFFSGSTYQMAVMNQYITRGLIRSVFTALVMITLLMIIVFKSVRLGLLAMIPNIFPVLIAGGIMGFLNIPLEFVTMTVAPMIMGLAVDDTIHLLWHLKNDLNQSNDFSVSVTRTFSVVGTAITETTIILCLTFLVFTFSKVNSIVNMGILSCSGMMAAYLADIFVTPILVKKLKYSHL